MERSETQKSLRAKRATFTKYWPNKKGLILNFDPIKRGWILNFDPIKRGWILSLQKEGKFWILFWPTYIIEITYFPLFIGSIFCKHSSLRSQTFLSLRTLHLAYPKLVRTPCRKSGKKGYKSCNFCSVSLFWCLLLTWWISDWAQIKSEIFFVKGPRSYLYWLFRTLYPWNLRMAYQW